jgi:hypothetical protein
MNRAMPGNSLLEVLLAIGWSAEKIKTETNVVWRDIGGRDNEAALVREIRSAMGDTRIRNPYAWAIKKLKRVGEVA